MMRFTGGLASDFYVSLPSHTRLLPCPQLASANAVVVPTALWREAPRTGRATSTCMQIVTVPALDAEGCFGDRASVAMLASGHARRVFANAPPPVPPVASWVACQARIFAGPSNCEVSRVAAQRADCAVVAALMTAAATRSADRRRHRRRGQASTPEAAVANAMHFGRANVPTAAQRFNEIVGILTPSAHGADLVAEPAVLLLFSARDPSVDLYHC